MQTFLPYPDFKQSAACLDYRRLGKQRVEGAQILKAILGEKSFNGKPYKGWLNHPATLMWKPYPDALKLYINTMIEEWVRRGYKNTMLLYKIDNNIQMPNWLGHENFHASHRSNLKRKDELYYQKYGWNESSDLSYVWPIKKYQNGY